MTLEPNSASAGTSGLPRACGQAVRQRRRLVAISATQLLAGVWGQVLALRRGLAFDIALAGWKGGADRVPRDSWLLGTGLSAPVVILATQAVTTARLASGRSPAAARLLGVLGVAMVAGYLVERETRTALSRVGWRPDATSAAALGLGLALPMAVLGLSCPDESDQEGNVAACRQA